MSFVMSGQWTAAFARLFIAVSLMRRSWHSKNLYSQSWRNNYVNHIAADLLHEQTRVMYIMMRPVRLSLSSLVISCCQLILRIRRRNRWWKVLILGIYILAKILEELISTLSSVFFRVSTGWRDVVSGEWCNFPGLILILN